MIRSTEYWCRVCGVPTVKPFRRNGLAYCSEKCSEVDVELEREEANEHLRLVSEALAPDLTLEGKEVVPRV